MARHIVRHTTRRDPTSPGEARQRRIRQAQHRPEQEAGYDEAVRGSADEPPADLMDRPPLKLVPLKRPGPDERAEAGAIRDARRRQRQR